MFEDHLIHSVHLSGAIVDLMNCFDRIPRPLLRALAKAAGLPDAMVNTYFLTLMPSWFTQHGEERRQALQAPKSDTTRLSALYVHVCLDTATLGIIMLGAWESDPRS